MSLTPATQLAAGGLERIYDAVQTVVPGVTFAVVQMAVWDTIDEFCTRSTYLRETLSWTLPPNERSVDLNPISAVLTAVWVLDVTGLNPYRVDPPAILHDGGDATQGRSGYAWVACKPTRLTTNLPAVLVDNWYETLKDGTLGRLYMQPAKPYSSKELALFHGTRFRDGLRLARDAARKFNAGPNPGTWQFPYFATGRRKQ